MGDLREIFNYYGLTLCWNLQAFQTPDLTRGNVLLFCKKFLEGFRHQYHHNFIAADFPRYLQNQSAIDGKSIGWNLQTKRHYFDWGSRLGFGYDWLISKIFSDKLFQQVQLNHIFKHAENFSSLSFSSLVLLNEQIQFSLGTTRKSQSIMWNFTFTGAYKQD